ncbi:MAG: pyruvate formate lyase-activating protein, partial [Chloroflexi bacterium]|nr:pyruvate formate lyase-activating protein [Chloroflexota bacterium]
MKILAIDIGTGTQDILLFDTQIEIENCLHMIMPSPTVLVAQKIRAATARGDDVLLTGTIMGGGPSQWAAEDHVRAGHRVFATARAAKSFNDEIAHVEKMGIRVIGDNEAARMQNATRVELRDVNLSAIENSFAAFGVKLEYDALAIAVFDHGDAPPGYSDRLFRFDFLAERLRTFNSPAAFAFRRDEIPPRLTRMRAVADNLGGNEPLIVMDTAPAAALGALEDTRVRAQRTALIANIGNFHTLAFRYDDGLITGVFEHHTGELKKEQLENFLAQLADSTLTHDAIFNSQGHGAVLLRARPIALGFLAVVGPRRGLLLNSRLRPYFATPYGDMMLAGCFGLVRAYAELHENARAEIEQALEK